VGFDEVLVPGEWEFHMRRRRLEEGIPVDDATWRAIREHALELGVVVDG
jgi:LDH2 family malate/lactate/ureidoglycolate dehydrogenase